MNAFDRLFPPVKDRPAIVGHRGAKKHAPENTLASFRLAIDQGADAVELDVHLSKDGVPVVIHDEDLERTTDGKGAVGDRTVEELKRLDAGRKAGAKFKGERIPTLAEAVRTITGRVPAVVELKNLDEAYPGLERKVVDVLRAEKALDRCIVISFDRGTVERVRALEPKVLVGSLGVEEAVGDLAGFGAHADAFVLNAGHVTREHVAEAARLGKPIVVWTVNVPAKVRYFARMGVAGIATDDPGAARAALARGA